MAVLSAWASISKLFWKSAFCTKKIHLVALLIPRSAHLGFRAGVLSAAAFGPLGTSGLWMLWFSGFNPQAPLHDWTLLTLPKMMGKTDAPFTLNIPKTPSSEA